MIRDFDKILRAGYGVLYIDEMYKKGFWRKMLELPGFNPSKTVNAAIDMAVPDVIISAHQEGFLTGFALCTYELWRCPGLIDWVCERFCAKHRVRARLAEEAFSAGWYEESREFDEVTYEELLCAWEK